MIHLLLRLISVQITVGVEPHVAARLVQRGASLAIPEVASFAVVLEGVEKIQLCSSASIGATFRSL